MPLCLALARGTVRFAYLPVKSSAFVPNWLKPAGELLHKWD